jgi:hypothetical protein
MEVSGQLRTPAALHPRERSPDTYWIGMLGGPQSQSGSGGEEKYSQPQAGLEPLIIQSVVLIVQFGPYLI